MSWGFLRETTEIAKKLRPDPVTHLERTGLDQYLSVIFPEIPPCHWIHDQVIDEQLDGKKLRYRPDYLCRSCGQKIIVEFDGVQHYRDPLVIRKDAKKDIDYKKLGYAVYRIPFFIQLTNEVVKILFKRKIKEPLFPEKIASLGIKGVTPASLSRAGIEHMAEDFKRYDEQYETNLNALKEINDEYLTGVSLLENAYNTL